MPRNVAEILESATRGENGLETSARDDLKNLDIEWQGIGLAGLPFIDFIPIRIVSLIERHVRRCLSEIIDFGEPYASRAIEILGKDFSSKNILEAFAATTAKKITLGRLVSFSFSIGRLNELIAILEAIFGRDFKIRIAEITTLWSDDDPNYRAPLITSLEKTLTTIDRLFRLRHLLVHEAILSKGVERTDTEQFFIHAGEFMEALSWLLVAQTRGPTPRTQVAIDLAAFEAAITSTRELDRLRGGTIESFQEPTTHNEQLEHHWDEFRRHSAERAAGFDVEQSLGSVATSIYASEVDRLTRWRIDHILSSRSKPEVDF